MELVLIKVQEFGKLGVLARFCKEVERNDHKNGDDEVRRTILTKFSHMG